MTEKEFRKLKALDLIQLLLTQSNEVSAQQEELERIDVRLELFYGENDIIKAKLNDRDALTELIKQKLNESDERIRELEKEVKNLYSDRIIELEDAGSLVQAALELNKIFEEAQKEAERYMYGAERGIEGRRYHAVGITGGSGKFRHTEPADRFGEFRHAEPADRQSELKEDTSMAEKLNAEEPIAEESIAEESTTEGTITEGTITEEPERSEPVTESVKPDAPPGLEAFDWRLEEPPQVVKTSEQKAKPVKETEITKEPEAAKPKGLFSRLFRRKQK